MDASTCASLGAMGPLLWKLDSVLAPGNSLPVEVKHEVELLVQEIKKINGWLMDLSEAEDDPPLRAKLWMKKPRELSYDMEDYFHQVMHFGAGAVAKARATGKSGIVKLPYLQKMKLKRQSPMATKIKEFRVRVQEACERYQRYALHLLTFQRRFVSYGPRLPVPNSELVDHGPMNELVKLTTGEGDKQLKVASIVGQGGVGKTTFARRLHQKIKGSFTCQAFVRASSYPDMRRLLTNIFFQIQKQQPHEYWDANHLIDNIAKSLHNKRYFIIIDDLWDVSVWNIVSRAFPKGSCCSQIVITTEIKDVALACCSYHSEYIFEMNPLNEQHSREVFFSRVFGCEGNCPEEFKDVSDAIIRKCGGLPLSILNIATMLAWEPVLLMEHWKLIERSLCSSLRTDTSSNLPQYQKDALPRSSAEESADLSSRKFSMAEITTDKNNRWPKNTSRKAQTELLYSSSMPGCTSEAMKRVLSLLYNNLPPHLKTCLLYLNMYPVDYTIQKVDLVKQWIAEDFLSAVEGRGMEEVAGGYFDELVCRGIVQPVDTTCNDQVFSCTVHHMVQKLIAHKSMECNFMTNVKYFQSSLGLPDMVRRLAVQFGGVKSANVPAGLRVSHVRSLMFFGFFKCVPSIVKYKLLRVLLLHIWGDEDKTCFDLTGLGELLLLRYLKIECNITVQLPEQMQGLQFLETMEVDARIDAVPLDIFRLPRLLHLRIPGGSDMPSGIGHLIRLRTLGYFDLSCNSEVNVQNLGLLINLQDLYLTCSTEQCNRLLVNMKVLGSFLGSLINLKSVTLVPGSARGSNIDARASKQSISCDGLSSSVSSPPVLLERLELFPRICIFYSLPKWIADLGKLCILKIAVKELGKYDINVLKGLNALVALSLYVCTAPGERILFDGGFPVLKHFKLVCSSFFPVFEKEAMPSVRMLKLGFNANRIEQYRVVDAGLENLLALEQISAKIGGDGADESDRIAAKSALEAASSKHPNTPFVNVQLADSTFKEEEEIIKEPHVVIEQEDPSKQVGEKDAGQDIKTLDEPRSVSSSALADPTFHLHDSGVKELDVVAGSDTLGSSTKAATSSKMDWCSDFHGTSETADAYRSQREPAAEEPASSVHRRCRFILDSEARFHVTGNLELFSPAPPPGSGSYLQLIDGSTLQIDGVGSIKTPEIDLSDVHYVSGFAPGVTVVSLSQLLESDLFECLFSEGSVSITTRSDGTEVGSGHLDSTDGYYTLDSIHIPLSESDPSQGLPSAAHEEKIAPVVDDQEGAERTKSAPDSAEKVGLQGADPESHNGNRIGQYRVVDAGLENLSALGQISAKIGGDGADESDRIAAKSALEAASSKHPNTPFVNVPLLDSIFKEEEEIIQQPQVVIEQEDPSKEVGEKDVGQDIKTQEVGEKDAGQDIKTQDEPRSVSSSALPDPTFHLQDSGVKELDVVAGSDTLGSSTKAATSSNMDSDFHGTRSQREPAAEDSATSFHLHCRFILDSEARFHVTGNLDLFSPAPPPGSGYYLQLMDGSTLQIDGVGSIKTPEIDLSDVHYVSGFAPGVTVVSLSQLLESDLFECWFSEGSVSITTRSDGTEVGSGHLDSTDGYYTLDSIHISLAESDPSQGLPSAAQDEKIAPVVDDQEEAQRTESAPDSAEKVVLQRADPESHNAKGSYTRYIYGDQTCGSYIRENCSYACAAALCGSWGLFGH
ncbi:hypothetical protein ACP70R_021468 [Stipagrostis hirtigluma subsp. patula]